MELGENSNCFISNFREENTDSPFSFRCYVAECRDDGVFRIKVGLMEAQCEYSG